MGLARRERIRADREFNPKNRQSRSLETERSVSRVVGYRQLRHNSLPGAGRERECDMGKRRDPRKQVKLQIRIAGIDADAENPTWGAPRIHGELLKLGAWIVASAKTDSTRCRPLGAPELFCCPRLVGHQSTHSGVKHGGLEVRTRRLADQL